jgi:carboxyl-terminal processing protease
MTVKIPKWFLLCTLSFFLSTGAKWSNDLFEFAKNLEIFSSVYKEVGEHYVDDVPPGELVKSAISAMLKTLDPYTVFFSEYQAEEALIERHGEYGGVGARIQFRDQQPIVTEIIKGYGFHKAGILLGDQIIKIDNTLLKDLGHEDMMPLFRGAPNSQFKIQLVRGKDTLFKTVTRSNIETKSVSFAGMLNSQIGYIKLDEFGTDCAREVETELKKLQQNPNFSGLILDLRNNGGGLLNEAVSIVGLFVNANTTVVNLKGKGHQGPKNWKTSQKPIALNLPLTVLINSGSASASEVVSGALQDLDRAVIIGQNSFGKGLVQNYQNLPYRTQMKITTARYYTPSGRCIQRLNYSKKDATGNATFKNASQKVEFRTYNGRVVFDGAGIDPDVILPLFNGKELLQWMEQEYLIFDWANNFTRQDAETMNINVFSKINNTDYYNNMLVSFEKFAIQNAPQIFSNKWKSQLHLLKSDTVWIKRFGWLSPNKNLISQEISQFIKANSNDILFELKKAVLLRLVDDNNYYSTTLKIDPEIIYAEKLLQKPETIAIILKSKNKK